MTEEPFEDMSRFEDDKTPAESGEKFTIDEWRLLTKEWDPFNVMLAQYATRLESEKREISATKLNLDALFGAGDEELFSFVADILSLSDPALGRLNKALLLNEMEESVDTNQANKTGRVGDSEKASPGTGEAVS